MEPSGTVTPGAPPRRTARGPRHDQRCARGARYAFDKLGTGAATATPRRPNELAGQVEAPRSIERGPRVVEAGAVHAQGVLAQ